MELERARFTSFVPYSKLYSFEELKNYQPLPPSKNVVQAYWNTYGYNTFANDYENDDDDFEMQTTQLKLTIMEPNNTTISLEICSTLDVPNQESTYSETIHSYFTDSVNPETIISCSSRYSRDYISGEYISRKFPNVIDDRIIELGIIPSRYSINDICNKQYYILNEIYGSEIIKPILKNNNNLLRTFYSNLKEKPFDCNIMKEYCESNREYIPFSCHVALASQQYHLPLKIFYQV